MTKISHTGKHTTDSNCCDHSDNDTEALDQTKFEKCNMLNEQ